MVDPVRVIQVGIGGFGANLARRLLDPPAAVTPFELAGVVDPAPRNADDVVAAVTQRGIVSFPSLEAALDGAAPELVIMATPIPLHAPQSITCLERGIPVLCEKPAAATVTDAEAMQAAAQRGGTWCAIGFQWSYSPPIQAFKADVLAGRWGRPLSLRSVVHWPRPETYYTRNGWAGRLHDAHGRAVFDSPISNATAHFLHNALYVLGEARDTTAMPVALEAETYRVNAIESYDTGVLRARLADDTEIMHAASHAVDSESGPVLSYQFQDALVTYGRAGPSPRPSLMARSRSGVVHDYGDPEASTGDKLWQCIAACRGGLAPACPVAAAIPALAIANATHRTRDVVDVPRDLVRLGRHRDDPLHYLPDLDRLLFTCALTGRLPSEVGGIPWAVPGAQVDPGVPA